ncbi:hypothetical protein BDB00DRAFT_815659 [Zychaea mexicana]|uniref:uncharacterized protein n=1 Tax=Zychaea mexicana TaxID=64656 RepID=UPI0022FE760D|nr:uncharacterized protein BDB00DRAFT_815659 [Zychaea mexicana]KAI9495053.1 hypothetical protein BDB00DRAFT_815659 [Zychaea mexicana]
MPRLYDEEPRSIFIIPNPFRALSHKARQIGVYSSGILFALGWWVFIDALIISAQSDTDAKAHMGFEDWVSGILSTLGMVVINLIDKSRLHGDAYEYAGSSLVWKARLFLFLGFALIAGGFAGSFCVLIIKYIVYFESAQPYTYYGAAIVVQCGLIMISTVVLWIAQNTQEEFEYNMRL